MSTRTEWRICKGCGRRVAKAKALARKWAHWHSSCWAKVEKRAKLAAEKAQLHKPKPTCTWGHTWPAKTYQGVIRCKKCGRKRGW